MNFVKQHRWFLIGLVSVGLVGWLRLSFLGEAVYTGWLFPLFIAWLCTPRHQFVKGSWLLWFAVWWMFESFMMSREHNLLDSKWTWLFPVVITVAGLRMMKVLLADAKASKNVSRAEGKPG
jgi:hypothetical protein